MEQTELNEYNYGTKIGFHRTRQTGYAMCRSNCKKGFNVTGYDVAKRTSHQVTIMPTIKDAVEGRDIVFVALLLHTRMDTMAVHPPATYQ